MKKVLQHVVVKYLYNWSLKKGTEEVKLTSYVPNIKILLWNVVLVDKLFFLKKKMKMWNFIIRNDKA